MQGLHLTADASGCDANTPAMREPAALRALCLAAVAQAGLTAVGELFHHFAPNVSDDPHAKPGGGGITGVVLLAESHLAVHTWPELQAVTLDVYVCNLDTDNSGRAETLLRTLERAFAPVRSEHHRVQRGGVLRPA